MKKVLTQANYSGPRKPAIYRSDSLTRRGKMLWEAQPWIWVEIIISHIPSQRRQMSRITSRAELGALLQSRFGEGSWVETQLPDIALPATPGLYRQERGNHPGPTFERLFDRVRLNPPEQSFLAGTRPP